MTWVSYNHNDNLFKQGLPDLLPGVFSLQTIAEYQENIEEVNQQYVKNYHLRKDIIVIFRSLKWSLNLQKSL